MEITSSLKGLKGKRVGLDSMIFIYAFEEHPVYSSFLKKFFSSLEKGELEATISTIAITECLVRPYLKKDFSIATQYIFLFRNFPNLSVHPVSEQIAERAAFLRAHYRLRTPDAIHLSTALMLNCNIFFTNDTRLLRFTDLPILILDKLI